MTGQSISRLLAGSALLLLAACGGEDEPSPDAGTDTTTELDAAGDTVGTDAGEDVALDIGGEDAAEDISVDVVPDVPDATEEVGEDATPDVQSCELDLCPNAGDLSCAGDVLSTCTLGSDGCLDWVETDCAASSQVCGDSGCEATVECDVPPEDRCDTADARRCAFGGPQVCTADGDGCLAWEARPACADGTTCSAGVCVDVCTTRPTCAAEVFCSGDLRVECATDADGCLVPVDRTECTSGCLPDTGECAASRCETFPCSEEDAFASCDGDVLVFCNSDTENSCYFELYEDCTESGGVCTDGSVAFCEVPPCGDGLWDGFVGEACDDGNTDAGDGCSETCEIEEGWSCERDESGNASVCARCGDGVISGTESCDDGDTDSGDGCSDSCQVEDTYACVGIPSVCGVVTCGDSVVAGVEGCDGGDGCTDTCALELSGGPGTSWTFEGAVEAGDPVLPDGGCEGNLVRFDGFTVRNVTDADLEVRIEAVWERADGRLEVHRGSIGEESCEDSNDDHPLLGVGASLLNVDLAPGQDYVIVAAGFDSATLIEAYTITLTVASCGDGVLDSTEACDDGNADDNDGCTSCEVDEGYECDDAGLFCFIPGCGEGSIDGDEFCDDGNTDDGDGCSAACDLEDGFTCRGNRPSDCRAIACGNGFVDGADACDDGNTDDGDGCSATCTVEPFFVCDDSTPSVCISPVCGDGTIELGESCDDGNEIAGDGCSAQCLLELNVGGTLEINGALTATDPVFVRADSDCDEDETFSYFRAYTIVNPNPTPVRVVVRADWTGDGYLHAYSTFTPADATSMCLEGSDDDTDEFDSRLDEIVLLGRETVTVVASTYDDFGTLAAFTLSLDTTSAD